MAELAPLLRALFDGPEPLLDRGGLSSLHAAAEQRYWRLQDLQSLLERAAMDGPCSYSWTTCSGPTAGPWPRCARCRHAWRHYPIGWVLPMRPDQGPAQLRSTVEYLADEGAERSYSSRSATAAVAQVASDVMRAEPDEALLRMAGEAGGQPLPARGAARSVCDRSTSCDRFRTGDAHRLPASRPSSHEHARATGPNVRVRASGRHRGRIARANVLRLRAGGDARPGSRFPALLGRTADRRRHRARARRPAVAFGTISSAKRCAMHLAPSARRALDRQAADVMLARGALPLEVAIQLAASAEPGDEVAITTLLRPPRHLATTDPGASRRPQPAGSGAGTRKASAARSARRPSRDVASRGGTDRGGEGVRG